MKDKIILEVKKLDKILKTENPSDDWMKGRHSAFRGMRARLLEILNEDISTSRLLPEKHMKP